MITGFLPPALKKKFLPPPPPLLGGWWTTGTPDAIHTNMDALQLWFTRRDTTNGLTNVGLFRGVIIDEAGCEFPSTQSGGNFASSPVMRALTQFVHSGPDASTCNWLDLPRALSSRAAKSDFGFSCFPSRARASPTSSSKTPRPAGSCEVVHPFRADDQLWRRHGLHPDLRPQPADDEFGRYLGQNDPARGEAELSSTPRDRPHV